MKITRENYEIYFIDYSDNKLSPGEKSELQAFLQVNDDLAPLLEDIENVRLCPAESKIHDISFLKKEEIHECQDYYAIAIAENSLTDADVKTLKHKDKKQLQELAAIYSNLKLYPDTTISFTKKKSLYRKSFWPYIYRTISVAAVLIISFGIGIAIMINKTDKTIRPVSLNNRIDSIDNQSEIPVRKELSIMTTISLSDIKIKSNPETDIHGAFIKEATVQTIAFNKDESIEQNPLPAPELKIFSIQETSSPELILTQNASFWQPSEPYIVTNSILSPFINAGKNLSERIRSSRKTIDDNQN